MEGRWVLDFDHADGAILKPDWLPERSMAGNVPVVPCDDAAIERATRAMALHGHERGPDDYWRELAEVALRAAGETP